MKHVYKLTPTSLYHLPELEFWLEEMALEGLYPTKIGSYFTRFQHGEPKKMRFRLESAEQDHEISPGKLGFYRESGWNYVCPVEKMYHLFCCGDDTAPELHTDPVTRSLSMETLNRKVRQYRIFTLLKPLLMILVITIPLFLVEWNISTEYPWIDAPNYIARMPLVLVDLSFLLLLFPYLFWSWLRTLHHCRVLTNLQKQLSEGLTVTPLPRKNSRKWMNLIHLALTALLVITLIVTAVLEHASFPLLEAKVPYLYLEELESEAVSPFRDSVSQTARHSYEDRIQYHLTALSPTYYQTVQEVYGLTPGTEPNSYSPDPEGGRYQYNPMLDASYFHLLVPSLAKPVALAQLDTYRLLNLDWRYEEVICPGTDFFILCQAENHVWQMAALGKDGRVAVFRYAGQEDLANHMNLLAQYVA